MIIMFIGHCCGTALKLAGQPCHHPIIVFVYIVTVSVSLLLSYHAATCQSCCFIVTDTISSLLWYSTEADCH